MSFPKVYERLRPRRGVNSDVPAWATGPDVWNQADNFIFRQGLAERAPSTQAVYDPPSVAPYIHLNTQIGGVNYWVYAGATASYAVQTTVHTDITHASTQQSQTKVNKLSLEQLNGVPVFNNALDEPMYWDGNVSNNFVDLPGWTATESCQFIVPHRFHLFACGIDGPSGNFPNQIKWSDAAAPGNVPSTWTAAATNEAGSTTLSDTPGPLVAAKNLRESLGIYKSGSTHICDYIGGEEIFQFRTVFTEAGALTRHAVADINGRHLVVTDGDVIVTDLVNAQSVIRNRRRRFLFNSLDQDNFENLFLVYNRNQNECWICFPEAGSTLATRAMIYDVTNDAWGDRQLDGIAFGAMGIINDTASDETWDADSQVWDADTEVWNRQNFSLANEELVLADAGNTDFLEVGRGSTSLTSVLSKSDLDFGEPERFKFIRRVYVRTTAGASVDISIRIGTRNTTSDTITYSAPVTLDTTRGYIDVMTTGRYVTVELTCVCSEVYTITGVDIEAELRGYF